MAARERRRKAERRSPHEEAKRSEDTDRRDSNPSPSPGRSVREPRVARAEPEGSAARADGPAGGVASGARAAQHTGTRHARRLLEVGRAPPVDGRERRVLSDQGKQLAGASGVKRGGVARGTGDTREGAPEASRNRREVLRGAAHDRSCRNPPANRSEGDRGDRAARRLPHGPDPTPQGPAEKTVTARLLIDLSHPIEPGMTTYPGLPGPVVSDFLSREDSRRKYAPGTTFQIGRIEMVANTGTYVDAPFHRIAGGQDIASLPLERLADLEGLVVTLPPLPAEVGVGEGIRGRPFDADLFERRDLEGKAVLLRSGWDSYWRTPAYGRGHPFVTRRAAEALVSKRPSLVGIDSVNIDDTEDGTRPAHTLLLQAGIPIVEHLCNLSVLPAEGFRFHCVPAPFLGVGSFPVRAYAVIGKDAP